GRAGIRRVSRIDLAIAPGRIALPAGRDRPKDVVRSLLRAVDVRARQVCGGAGQANGLLEGLERLRHPTRTQPFGLVSGYGRGKRARRYQPSRSVNLDDLLHALVFLGRLEIEPALPVFGHEGVEIDHRGDAAGLAVGDAGRDEAAIAVPNQDNPAEVL